MVDVGPASQCESSGVPGMALQCSGTNGYGLTHDLGLETNTFTAMAWVKPEGIQPDYTAIVIAGGNGGGFNFRQNNELGYHWPNGAWWWSSGTPTTKIRGLGGSLSGLWCSGFSLL